MAVQDALDIEEGTPGAAESKLSKEDITEIVSTQLSDLERRFDTKLPKQAEAKQESKFASLLKELKDQGYDENSLRALSLSFGAALDDFKREIKQELETDRQRQVFSQIEDFSINIIEEELSKYSDILPPKKLNWAQDNIMKKIGNLILRGKGYDDARERVGAGKPIPRKDLSRALDKVMEEFCEDHDISRDNGTKQVDTKDSKVTPKSTSRTVDVRSMSDTQRNVYHATYNAVKGKEEDRVAAAQKAAARFAGF